MNENLQNNSFFLALLDHIPDLERSCVEKGWILCIPQSAALPEAHRISLRLLRMHVLIPDPKLSTEYRTLNSTIIVRRVNEKELETRSGTTVVSTVNILYREVIYCGARGDDSYTALCVSRPLDGYGQVPLLDDGSETFAEERSAEDWDALLFKDAYARKQLLELENKINTLESPLAGKKEPSAYTEIRLFAERMCKENLDTRFEAARTNQKFATVLQTGYETAIASACHPMLFAALSQLHAQAEKHLQLRLHDLRKLVFEQKKTAEHAGLTREFLNRFDYATSPAFVKATEHIQRINECKSPLEKLWCVRDASRVLREMPGNDNMDDSLPLFLLSLISAAPGLLLANLAFMSDFAPRLWVKAAGELAFHCTVLSGAVSLIQAHAPESVDDNDRSLLKNLVVIGGSGLSSGWGSGALKKDSSSDISPLKWFEACAPAFRS